MGRYTLWFFRELANLKHRKNLHENSSRPTDEGSLYMNNQITQNPNVMDIQWLG